MSRPQKFSAAQILDTAATLVAADGPGAATIGAISARLKAPSGSIYHRFASRDVHSLRHAPHMMQLDWAPLVGALVVTEKSWNRLTPKVQRELAGAAALAGRNMKQRNLTESDTAVKEMVKRGLKVSTVPPAVESEWRQMVEKRHGQFRGGKIPTELFDEVQRLLAEYRQVRAGAGATK